MTKNLCLMLVLSLSVLPGCIVLVQGDGRGHHHEDEEDECLLTFNELRTPFVYDYKTDCGDGSQGAIELRKIRSDAQQEHIGAKIQIFSGEETLRQGKFLSTCDGTTASMQLDFKYGYGENDSTHAFYRCSVDMNALGGAHDCALLLSDGKPLDDGASCTVSLFLPINGEPPRSDG